MNVVDSSCWLEYFAGGKTGEKVSAVIGNVADLLVPSVILYEVFKKLLIELDEDRALFAVAHIKQGRVVELDADLSIYSAKIGQEYKLPLADSIIYATCKKYGAVLWTQDSRFEHLENVRYFPKEPANRRS